MPLKSYTSLCAPPDTQSILRRLAFAISSALNFLSPARPVDCGASTCFSIRLRNIASGKCSSSIGMRFCCDCCGGLSCCVCAGGVFPGGSGAPCAYDAKAEKAHTDSAHVAKAPHKNAPCAQLEFRRRDG